MLHLVLALDPAGERFTVLLGLLLAILTLLGAMIRAGWRVVKAAIGQLEATRENTTAIHELTQEMKKQNDRISVLEQARQ